MTLFIFVAMQLVNRSEIDVKKWDQLVDNTAGVGFFSYSWYLDHIAENWAAIVDDDYTKGIAVPFTVRMGVKVAYTPIFVSYVEWLGEDAVDQDKLLSILRISFSGFYLAVNKQLFNIEFEKYVCQMITKRERLYN